MAEPTTDQEVTIQDLESTYNELVEMYTEYSNYTNTNNALAKALKISVIKNFEISYETSRKMITP